MQANPRIVNENTLLIDRARRAFLRRNDFDGTAPIIRDCLVLDKFGRRYIELREGEMLLGSYLVKSNGELKYEPVKGRLQ